MSLLAAPSGASATVIFLTSGTSWTVPIDWNDASNTVECVGSGGTGAFHVGGPGGAYAKRSNVALPPGGTVSYAVGTASSTLGASGGNTWFGSTSVLECAGGGSGGPSNGDVTYAGGAGGTHTAGNSGPGGGGAAGPNAAGLAGGDVTSGTQRYAGAGGAGDNGNAAGGAGGSNAAQYGGDPNGGAGSSEMIWTQTSDGSVAGPGGGGGGSGSDLPNAGVGGGKGGYYGGGSGSPGRGSPDVGSNYPGRPGIIVITYTPLPPTDYTYDANGRLSCAATPDGYFSSYIQDYSDNRTLVVRNTSACTAADQSQLPVPHNVSATVMENSGQNWITLSFTGGTATAVSVVGSAANGVATASSATICYSPNAGYSGPDSFQYEGYNSQGTSTTATVSITVTAIPSAPAPTTSCSTVSQAARAKPGRTTRPPPHAGASASSGDANSDVAKAKSGGKPA